MIYKYAIKYRSAMEYKSAIRQKFDNYDIL